MNISALSDEELNRAMIWLHPPERSEGYIKDEPFGVYSGSYEDTIYYEYLTDWNLTGPLQIANGISLDVINHDGFISCDATHDTGCAGQDVNPLRAICECVLMIYMEVK